MKLHVEIVGIGLTGEVVLVTYYVHDKLDGFKSHGHKGQLRMRVDELSEEALKARLTEQLHLFYDRDEIEKQTALADEWLMKTFDIEIHSSEQEPSP